MVMSLLLIDLLSILMPTFSLGVLSILSRDESNKLAISKDSLDLILNAMNIHIDRVDVQEVGCELIWSLAFKNNLVKEMIAKYGGTLIIVRALKRHHRSADFLKNVCGALSNICQWKANQESIASQGGLPPLAASLHLHIDNMKILPFIMDAIASLIVSNEENARTVSSLGIIPLINTCLSKYPTNTDVVKSGCHTLAILTDVKGQASKISYSGGVASILHILHLHPSFVDLHRVAFVVLLRMLQESVHVARDMVQVEGVRVLLESLNAGGAQDDTVAAVTHILYTVTNPNVSATSMIESQLWQSSSSKCTEDDPKASARPQRAPFLKAGSVRFQQTMLGGLVQILGTYCLRRDVVRSSVRTLNHIMGIAGVAPALNGLLLLDSLFRCAARHQDVRDIHDCVAHLLKTLASKRTEPALTLKVEDGDIGFLTVFKARIGEEEGVEALIDLSLRILRMVQSSSGRKHTISHQALASEIYTCMCRRLQTLKDMHSDGFLKKPLRYCTAMVAMLDYLALNVDQLTDCIIEEGSILDCMIDMLGEVPLLQQDIQSKVNALRTKVEKLRSRISADVSRSAEAEGVPVEGDAVILEINDIAQPLDLIIPSPRQEYSATVAPSVAQEVQVPSAEPLLEISPSNPEPIQLTSTVAPSLFRSQALFNDKLQIVYESTSAAGKGIPTRVAEEELPYELPLTPEQPLFPHSISFDSEFESGNLLRAIQRDSNEYDLLLRSDLHTSGHTQWFYFAVTNTHPPSLVSISSMGLPVPEMRVKFNVINLTKPDSLFNSGMQMVMYSKHNASTKNIGWVRTGSEICYYANQYPRRSTAGEGENNYYTLTFTIEFPNPKDTYLLAYTYPYTHRDYLRHVESILNSPGSSNMIRRSKLCRSLGGYDCDLLVVTNFIDKKADRIGPLSLAEASVAPKKSKSESKTVKPCLFFTARVHPGETQASWMMLGMLKFLVSSAPAAQFLREAYVIFLVPMLNIDGVVFGNSRCGLAGVDLNRMWRNPTPQHPSVLALKTLMLAQRKCRDIAMFIDLHGHTRKHNVFMYGCGHTKKTKLAAQAFPKFLSMTKSCKRFISFPDCSFHVKKSREATARVVVCKEIGVVRR